MLPIGLALHDPEARETPNGMATVRDLGAAQTWAANAAHTAPGARAIHATSFAERLGALTAIEERVQDGQPLQPDMVECLLYLVATDPQHSAEAAQLLPVPWWPVAVEALVHARAWWGLFAYMERMTADGPALADEIFDHIEILLAAAPPAAGDQVPAWARAWWQRRDLDPGPSEGHESSDGLGSSAVAAITTELREHQVDLAGAVSPSKATAYVRARYTSAGASGSDGSSIGTPPGDSWAALIGRIDDPRMLRLLFDQQADLGYDLHLGYPYRRACLANPVLPVDLADRQVVDCGARPGPVRRQVKKVADSTCLDLGVEASRCATAEVVASLLWADPQRWWREVVAPPGKQPLRSRGYEPGPVTWADRAREFHHALAAVISQAVTSIREGAVDVDEVRVAGQVLATRGQGAEQRLLWLLENACGPGFEAVLEVAVAHPEIKVVRRAASHQQLPPAVAADLIAHRDRWVRAGAERAFTRALGDA